MIDIQNLQAVQAWLTQSIFGILVLGAAGSVLGTIVIYAVKYSLNKLHKSTSTIAPRIFYVYQREFHIGDKAYQSAVLRGKEIQFLAFSAEYLAMFVVEVFAFLLSLTLAGYVAISYGISRPYLISSLVALSILILHQAVRSLARIAGMSSPDMNEFVEKATQCVPKSYSEWQLQQEKSNNQHGNDYRNIPPSA